MMLTVNENDWKLFRRVLPLWQEAYIEKLVEEYKELLNSKEKASSKFWALEKRIRKDKKCPGVLIIDVRRSNMEMLLRELLCYGVICPENLNDFSSELKNRVQNVERCF